MNEVGMLTPRITPNQIRSMPRCSAAGPSSGMTMKASSKKSRKNASTNTKALTKTKKPNSLPGGEFGFLVFVNAFVFVLAFFLDFFELAFIVIPLLGPAAEHLGIDLIWFGVILGVNMQTSRMTPNQIRSM